MATPDSALDPQEMARARALLASPEAADDMWGVLAAAGFFAIAAVTFATVMILAPPLVSEHLARSALR